MADFIVFTPVFLGTFLITLFILGIFLAVLFFIMSIYSAFTGCVGYLVIFLFLWLIVTLLYIIGVVKIGTILQC